LPTRDNPEKYLRWRVVAGDPARRRRRRWPVGTLGSGLTEVPGGGHGPAGPWHRVFVGRMVVAAESVRWLRHLLDHPVTLARVRRIDIVVDEWRIPQRGWSGRLGPVPHLLAHRIRLPRRDQGRVRINLDLRWSVPLRSALAAVLPLLTPVRPLPAPASPDVTAQDVLPDWLGAGPNRAAVAGELPGDADIRPHDVVLRPDGTEPAFAADPSSLATGAVPAAPAAPGEEPYRALLTVDRAGTVALARAQPRTTPVLIDVEYAVSAGRYGPFSPDAPRVELRFATGPGEPDWRIVGPGGVDRIGTLERPWLTEEEQAALAGIGSVECRLVPGRQPAREVALLLHLIAAGLPVYAPELPPACRAYLVDEVVALVTSEPPGRYATPLDREVRAVRQRRAVLRGHGRAFRLAALAAPAFPGVPTLPSVSALLVTRRLSHVVAAVAAIEAQSYPALEIVLCLHGVTSTPELRSRLAGCTRPVQIHEVPAAQSFGAALGTATARARGSLVTKVDDDDTYGPEHVWDLVLARHHSGATLVGKAAEFVYLAALNTTVRRDAGAPESYTTAVAGGTMLISRGDLEELGGWRPVPRSVDRGLIDRVRRAGGLVYRTHPLGYVYHRRHAGHTWDPGLEYFLRGGGTQWSGLPRHPEFGTAPDGGGQAGAAPHRADQLGVASAGRPGPTC